MVNLVLDGKKDIEYDRNIVVLKEELANIYNQIEALGGRLSDPDDEIFRIKQITNLVNIADGIGLRLANQVLSKNNSIGIMTEKGAGTKGAVANIGQMMGAVGQQFYQGERLQPTITGNTRLLPCYDVDDINPEANAFIPTSFFTGVGCEGLFFLQSGNRESLLDTALKTQETGSMQHRLIKALDTIVIGYDGSIRNTIGDLFNPIYNSGYDIGEMMMVDYPGKSDFSSFVDVKSFASELNIKRGWIPKNVNEMVVNNRAKVINIINDNIPGILPTTIKQPITTDLRDIYKPDNPRIINKFEKSRLIAARAVQLSNNAVPLVDIGDEIDVVKIAEMEFNAGLLENIDIVRKFPAGNPQLIAGKNI
jgi:DNA-directed RNA polymerase subunit K/omega